MTATAAGSAAGPVPGAERIDALDVLRGFALLGILVMNIQMFAMPDAAYFNPTAYGDLEGTNFQVWLWSRLLADQKFMTIFSMLFGAGIVLMAGRAGDGGDARRRHYRRTAWLGLLGLLHAHLLWSGDILYVYAICGMLVFPLRRLSPRLLLAIGAATLALGSVVSFAFGASLQYWPEAARTELINTIWQPTAAAVGTDLAAYRGGWLEQLPSRSAAAFGAETFMLLIWALWRASGLMLIGMALFKLDVFGARRSRRFYAGLATALLLGLSIDAYGVALDFRYGWDVWSFFQGKQFNYWGSIPVSLGYVGLVMLACQTPALRGATRPLAAIGQTALTNYLLQTVICTTIFYGHGLGWYGSVDRLGQIGMVAGVWVVQLIAARLWLQRFRFGPAEWCLRALTYRTLPALQRA